MEPELLRALLPLVETFEELGVDYEVGGSMASSLHGAPRSSLDIDLLSSLRSEHVNDFVNRIEERYYVSPSRAAEAVECGSSFNVIHLDTMFKFDIFIARSNVFRCESLHRKRRETLGHEPHCVSVFVTSAEDIVLHWFRKGGEVSNQQWQDVIAVLKVQSGNLDLVHLRKWAAELSVVDLLERAFSQALGD